MQRDFNNPVNNPNGPNVITDEMLLDLSRNYIQSIRNGESLIKTPKVTIRYVKGRDEFGYASLRDVFFFDEYGMYVWDKESRWAEDHNQHLVEEIYGHPITGRGYAHRVIYAGISTGWRDKNGDLIYTGDVIRFFDDVNNTYAIGALDFGYGAILDNHVLMLRDVDKQNMERVGTIFFQLENEPFPKGVTDRTKSFNGWYDTIEERQLKNLMAQFTPNFDLEIWKYKALKVLEIEFNWRK